MEYNKPSELVKTLSFDNEARQGIMNGINKLADAVQSTLGASGMCVIYEDEMGKPIITKDGVTVANSVVLVDAVENMGANLCKQAARDTVDEAGDGTTTATVLTRAILKHVLNEVGKSSIRDIKKGLFDGLDKVLEYIDENKKPITADNGAKEIAYISTNGDEELSDIIAHAYKSVGADGVVSFTESPTHKTYAEIIKGVKFDSGLKTKYLANDETGEESRLDNPYILISASTIPSTRKIQNILEKILKENRSLLIISSVDQQPLQTLLANKVKNGMKVNVVDTPGFGPTRIDTLNDIAIATGATVIDEEIGDSFDFVDVDILGSAEKSITNAKSTIITTNDKSEVLIERIEHVKDLIKKEENEFIKKKLEDRLMMLNGSAAVIKVGGYTPVEMKEKKDRVEDAVFAVVAALRDGVVPGGGICLYNASKTLRKVPGELSLAKALTEPFNVILKNAGLTESHKDFKLKKGFGINAENGEVVDMMKAGIIDPALVTKTALKNAVSVASTVLSAGCVISITRSYEGTE